MRQGECQETLLHKQKAASLEMNVVFCMSLTDSSFKYTLKDIFEMDN